MRFAGRLVPPEVLLRLAIRNLSLHRLRSALSILGVVFGVGAVIAMSSVGEGARREALAQVAALGVDTVTVRHRPGADRGPTLRLQDVETLAKVVPGVVAAAPIREANLTASSGSNRTEVVAIGTSGAYRSAGRMEVSSGRFLSDVDRRDRSRVAVLGAAVARQLYPVGNPVGERIRLGGDWVEVVGVLASRGGKGRAGAIRVRDVNRTVLVPLETLDYGKDSRPDGIDEIALRIADAESVSATAEVVRSVLARTTNGAPLDIFVPREILRQRQRTQRVFDIVTGAIAAISLIVGGIGIMNIMLASVAERTREIGVRRALGARRRDIVLQFLVEASLLTTSGGLLGALAGLAGAGAIQWFAGWPTAVAPGMLATSLLMALGVGLGFGLYPAWHAAELEPIEALRRD